MMDQPVPTPTFDDDGDLAAFLVAFARPPYDPQAALGKAQAVFPAGFQRDSHWLPLALICANGGLEWIMSYVDWKARHLDWKKVRDHLGALSGGEYVLATFALHLFNDWHQLPPDGLTNLRLLDDWHFELAMHAIRIHSRGVR